MATFFAVLAGLVVLWAGSRAFARMDRRQAQRWARVALGVAAMGLGAFLSMRGLAMIGAPIAVVGLGLAGLSARPGARTQTGNGPSRPGGGAMSRAEALDVLGLQEGASADDIRKAHRELMKRVHPDTGGSADLARRIQQARDVLLG